VNEVELTLRYYGDSVLRARAVPVETFDDELREFATAMAETMRRERGIGLAAPQVGERKRVIVAMQMTSTDDDFAEPIALVNPKVLERSQETWVFEEGCLSLPGIVGDIMRSETISVRYDDVEGNEHTVTAKGMFARILLHEIDHLDGRLFIDYLSPAKKSLLKPRLKEIAARRSA
jgi:peptide deformylase